MILQERLQIIKIATFPKLIRKLNPNPIIFLRVFWFVSLVDGNEEG